MFSGSTWPFAAHVVPDKLFGQHHSKGLVVHCSGRTIVGAKNVRIGYGHIKQETKYVLVVRFCSLWYEPLNWSPRSIPLYLLYRATHRGHCTSICVLSFCCLVIVVWSAGLASVKATLTTLSFHAVATSYCTDERQTRHDWTSSPLISAGYSFLFVRMVPQAYVPLLRSVDKRFTKESEVVIEE